MNFSMVPFKCENCLKRLIAKVEIMPGPGRLGIRLNAPSATWFRDTFPVGC